MPRYCNRCLRAMQATTNPHRPASLLGSKKPAIASFLSGSPKPLTPYPFVLCSILRQKLFKPAPELGEEIYQTAVVRRLQIAPLAKAPECQPVGDRPRGVAQLHFLRTLGKRGKTRGEPQYRLGQIGCSLYRRAPAGQNNAGGQELVLADFFEMRLDQLKHVAHSARDDGVNGALGVGGAEDRALLQLLGLFGADAQAQGKVVGDVGRADGEYFYRNGERVLKYDDRKGLGADVGQNAAHTLLHF